MAINTNRILDQTPEDVEYFTPSESEDVECFPPSESELSVPVVVGSVAALSHNGNGLNDGGAIFVPALTGNAGSGGMRNDMQYVSKVSLLSVSTRTNRLR